MQENSQRGPDKRRTLNGKMGLTVPEKTVEEKCQRYMENGKPILRKELTNETDFTIISSYQAEYRGMVEYYRLAYNLTGLSKLKWVMEQSLVKTLASKQKMTVANVYKRYQTQINRDGKTYQGLEVKIEREGKDPLIAQWGGISLIGDIRAKLNDQPLRIGLGRTEIVQRLLADTCEYCGSTENIEVHHVRGLKDLNKHTGKEKPEWVKLMAARQRKTMVVCRTCHQDITYGRPMRQSPSGKGFMHDPKGWHASQTRT